MIDIERIPRGMEVLDVDLVHVGIVEHHEGTGIKLSHRDAPDHQHHYIPHHWIARVDEQVHLSRKAADVFDTWPGGYPSGLTVLAPVRALKGPGKPRNWRAWGLLGVGGAAGLLLLFL